MMKILILSLIFSPDNVSTAQIWSDIAEDLKAAGHELCVITTTPHFHRDPSMEAKQPLRRWIGRLVQRSAYAGIPVYHVLMPNKGCPPPIRMLSWVGFHIVSTLLGWFLRFRPDVVIAPSPPLTIGLNAWAIASVRRAKFIYNVQEIYPDIAVNLGIMKNKTLIRFFSGLERFIYRKAAFVTSITKGMCAKIAERTDREKVKLVPNFVDLSDVEQVPRKNAFAEEHGLGNEFVLTYAGNMGVPQRLDVMVELARRIPELTVLFVGGGGDAARLRELAHGLANVIFVDYQPISRMPEIYAASDLFYVGQDAKACSDGIPSKIYRILGYGKPLLVMTKDDSDLAAFVRDSSCGQLLGSDMEEGATVVRKLMGDKATLRGMGEKGCEYVKMFFTRSVVSGQYDSLCRALSKERKGK